MSSFGYYYPRPFNAQKKNHKRDPDPFFKHWAENSLICGLRHSAGQALNARLQNSMSTTEANLLEALGMDLEETPRNNALAHKVILKLDHKHLEPGQFSKKAFCETVKHNTDGVRTALKENEARQFFNDVSFKDYAKKTLWANNIQPIKDLKDGITENKGMNWAYTGSIALIGFSVLKKGYKAHKYWKKREDGSLSSKWRTAFQVTKATSLKFLQAVGCWEAAGFGMAIGCALIPIGGIPLGGIAIGALFSTIAYKAISKLLPSLKKYQ